MDFRKKPPERNIKPSSQTLHRGFLNELRLDFNQRCGYCDLHDSRMGGKEQYEVDHFIPLKQDKTKRLEYTNLVYSCRPCNRFKASKYSVSEPMFIDPENIKYGGMFSISDDFRFCPDPEDPNAKYMFKELKLYLLLRQKLNILDEFNYIEDSLTRLTEEEASANSDVGTLLFKIINFRKILTKGDA